jgi:hypothetical protein
LDDDDDDTASNYSSVDSSQANNGRCSGADETIDGRYSSIEDRYWSADESVDEHYSSEDDTDNTDATNDTDDGPSADTINLGLHNLQLSDDEL